MTYTFTDTTFSPSWKLYFTSLPQEQQDSIIAAGNNAAEIEAVHAKNYTEAGSRVFGKIAARKYVQGKAFRAFESVIYDAIQEIATA